MAGKQVDQSQVHLRLPESIAAGVDQYINDIEKYTRAPYAKTDAVISLIARGLEAWKAEARGKKS